ncbi:hypothetical protein GW17_00053485 [Ensete ventricosum]|nr:hypothetical protein GW17_00053485 [Ensete ventricosum]
MGIHLESRSILFEDRIPLVTVVPYLEAYLEIYLIAGDRNYVHSVLASDEGIAPCMVRATYTTHYIGHVARSRRLRLGIPDMSVAGKSGAARPAKKHTFRGQLSVVAWRRATRRLLGAYLPSASAEFYSWATGLSSVIRGSVLRGYSDTNDLISVILSNLSRIRSLSTIEER